MLRIFLKFFDRIHLSEYEFCQAYAILHPDDKAASLNIYSVLSVLEGAGLEVIDIVVNGLSTYHEVKDEKLDKQDGAIINLGHETTTVSIYENGKLVNNETLQIGGINVEKDLAYVFGLSVFDGRLLKEKFASSHKRFCQLNEIYEVEKKCLTTENL